MYIFLEEPIVLVDVGSSKVKGEWSWGVVLLDATFDVLGREVLE